MRLRLFFFSTAFVLASCGGGGGASSIPSAPASSPTPAPTATPTAQPTFSPSASTAKMTFTIPRGKKSATAHRKPNFISPSVSSIKITINSVNGSAPPLWVTPNPDVQNLITSGTGQNCTLTETSETCTITVLAPPGSVNYTFDLYDSTNANGNKIGTKTATFTLAQGQNNTLSVGFQGIVSWVSFSAGGTLIAGQPTIDASPMPLYVSAYDEDDNLINSNAGSTNFDNPISITIGDTSGATSLSVGASPNCPGTSSVTMNAPTDSVWICYTGLATSGVSVSASEAAGGPAGESITGEGSITSFLNTISLGGTTTCDANAGCAQTDPDYGQPTVFFSLPGSAQTFTAGESGWSGAPYNQSFDLSLDANTCGSGASAVVTLSSNPATSWTVTPLNVGICKGTVTEHTSSGGLQQTTVWFSVTAAQIQGF
jgi:hypothetical protein